VLIAATGVALGEDDSGSESEPSSWEALEASGLDGSALAERAAAALPALSDDSSTHEMVTVYDRVEPGRVERAKQVSAAMDRAIETLRALGMEASLPEATVVVLRTRDPGAVASTSAVSPGVIVLRERGETAPAVSAEVPKRYDGPPLLRDWVLAGDAIRVEGGSRPTAGPGSRSFALARHAVGGWEGSGGAPAWLLDGVAALVEERAFPEGKTSPFHVCGDQGFSRLADLLDGSRPSSAGRVRLLGRVLESLATAEPAAFAQRLAAAAAASDAAAAFSTAFGRAADEAHEGVTKALGRPSCEGGRAPCPLCRGTKTVEAACPVCAGLGAVGCPSCGATSDCPSDTCIAGWHHYVDSGKKSRCKYCANGVVKCRACSNQGRAPCKACGGGGRATVPCPGCGGEGRVACGEAKAAAETPACPWCAAGTTLRRACEGCGGAGYAGCDCGGTTRVLCRCGGTGERRMVYEDGTAASATTCDSCEGNGFRRCGECQNGKSRCACGGAAVLPPGASSCPLCEGDQRLPTAARSRERLSLLLGRPTAADVARNGEMVAKAVRFLLQCRDDSGAFVLMHFRPPGKTELVPLEEPTLFSNADVLWSLAVAGIGRDDERVRKAWAFLDEKAGEIVGTKADAGTQAASLALRALVAGGEPAKSPLVRGLVDRLCAAQRPDGLWGETLLSTEKGDPYSALYAVESLRLAAAAGARVPGETWSRAFGGAVAAAAAMSGSKKKDYATGTGVASATALVVMAKAGTLGSKAGSLDAYRSIPAVQKGLAWLDRHFDVREEPVVSAGARVPDRSDRGYAAYLYAIQRLAGLLSIDVLAGERWHATGSRHLATLQREDGSWEESGRGRLNGPVRTTTSAVLFLLRATPPLTSTGNAAADGR
jgi:hypothetical protein